MQYRMGLRILSARIRGAFAILTGRDAKPRPERVAGATEGPSQGLLINLTSGEENMAAVGMALTLASRAQHTGRRTIVFLNVHAVALATRDIPEHAGRAPVKRMLTDLVRSGARLYACEHCLRTAGIESERLLAGIRPIDAERLLDQVGELGPRTISLCY